MVMMASPFIFYQTFLSFDVVTFPFYALAIHFAMAFS